MEEEVGKNGEWIWLWGALTASVLGALCELARAIHNAGKKVGSASCKPRSHTAQRGPSLMRKIRNSSARGTGLLVCRDG